ncbi:FAD-binding protein, partial [Candidatus Parcubacteria bacterium]
MISNDCRIKLKEIFTDRYLENEPLSRHINFRVGGPAAVFCIVKNINELTEALSIIGDRCNHFILGGGTNVLASDRGFDGVVFKISLNSVDFQKTDMIAEAGVLSVVAARIAAEHGLSGLEWASTLPGTVGGMVRGNAGCFGGEAKDVIKYVRIIRAGKIIKLNNKDLKFSYRHSLIKDTNDIVLEAVFALQRGDKEEIKKKMAEIMVARKKSQPLKSGTAGCTFKNYEIRDNDD